MPNNRVISSATFEDRWFGELTDFECLVWIGLFANCADSQGRLVDSTPLIRSKLFPYRDAALAGIEKLLASAAANYKIYRYQVKGESYIQILNWWEYQYPRYAGESDWPAPAGWIDHVNTTVRGESIKRAWYGTDKHIEYERAYIDALRAGTDPATLQVAVSAADAVAGSITNAVTDTVIDTVTDSVTALPVSVPNPVPDSIPDPVSDPIQEPSAAQARGNLVGAEPAITLHKPLEAYSFNGNTALPGISDYANTPAMDKARYLKVLYQAWASLVGHPPSQEEHEKIELLARRKGPQAVADKILELRGVEGVRIHNLESALYRGSVKQPAPAEPAVVAGGA